MWQLEHGVGVRFPLAPRAVIAGKDWPAAQRNATKEAGQSEKCTRQTQKIRTKMQRFAKSCKNAKQTRKYEKYEKSFIPLKYEK